MTREQLVALLQSLKDVFHEVRLVDPTLCKQISVSAAGHTNSTSYKCYSIWNKKHPCGDCVAAKSLAQHRQFTKFELVDGQVYNIVSKYLEVDGQPQILELIYKVSNETLFSAFGKTEFLKNIMDFSNSMYTDPLTGAYNRRFFEEQFCRMENQSAVAFTDIDHFKAINDTYGHDVGDLILRTVVETIINNVRTNDTVVRYGGEEFVISFGDMQRELFVDRLEQIRLAVKDISFAKFPNLKPTISLGGVYGPNCERKAMVKLADTLCYKAKTTRDAVKAEFLE